MFSWINSRMVSKIFLAIALVSGIAFLTISLLVGKEVEGALQQSSRDSAEQMTRMVRSSLEQAMLSGNGIKVKRLVQQLKDSVETDTQIHIYDANGIEVFAPLAEVPKPEQLNAKVAAVLAGGPRQSTGNEITRPIPMEKRCGRDGCHSSGDSLRGVLSLRVNPEACQSMRAKLVTRILKNGFVHLMTARRSNALDDYFDDIGKAAPSIQAVAVYDNEGDPSFGFDMEEFGVTGPEILKAMSHGKAHSMKLSNGTLHVLPLERQARCVECHEEEEALRGALLVALGPPSVEVACDERELEALVDISLRHIMISELGRIIARFLDSVAELDAVEELVLYDNEGRTYWNTKHPVPPPHIATVLASQARQVDFSAGDQRVRVVEPLRNTKECARCHGADMPLRGLVEVSLSTELAVETRQQSKRIVYLTTALAVISMFFVLIVLLQILVIRPVREISNVATSVSEGDLDVAVQRADSAGDEVARLGDRINKMVGELRTKFHLEKFVSKGAAAAAKKSGHAANSQDYAGQRVEATVLFSDIRGFTSYSESVEAEEVVAMLNRLLKVQTDVVHKYDGDVDKFVGDELMAIFQGPGASQRAALCGLEMVEAVQKRRESGLSVGVGISSGEVIMGAVGHEDRQDYTVIGDVVNTGARLCSAADPDVVLVTQSVWAEAKGADCEFETMEALSVKGKKEALMVYRAHKKS